MSQTADKGDDLARPSDSPEVGGAVEVTPIRMWGKDTRRPHDDDLYDFSPKADANEVDETEGTGDESPSPKDSSAPVSAVAAYYERTKTPTRAVPESDSSESPETPASADKASTPPKVTESGTPTSSSKTKSGSDKQPAATSQ